MDWFSEFITNVLTWFVELKTSQRRKQQGLSWGKEWRGFILSETFSSFEKVLLVGLFAGLDELNVLGIEV